MIIGGLKMTVQWRVPVSLIDLWIAIDYSNADENESMIGEVRLTNKVLGTVKDTLFFFCSAVCPTGDCDEMRFQFPTRCVCWVTGMWQSAEYILAGYLHPLFMWRQVLRRPRTCRGVSLFFVDQTLFYVIIAFMFVQDVSYTYLKRTCFGWSS